MKIILDAMGGDLAPEAPVLGALDAVKEYGAEVILEAGERKSWRFCAGMVSTTCLRAWRSATPLTWWICTMTPARCSTSGRIPPW